MIVSYTSCLAGNELETSLIMIVPYTSCLAGNELVPRLSKYTSPGQKQPSWYSFKARVILIKFNLKKD
jgi:hypothetical protein